MKIRKYTTVDVYYNEEEVEAAEKKKKQLLKQGYELNMSDTGTPYDYCDQYIKYLSGKKPKAKPINCKCEYVMRGDKFKCKHCGESIGDWIHSVKNKKK